MRTTAMVRPAGRVAVAAFWVAFPLVPLLAEDAYYRLCTLEFLADARDGPDPYDWDTGRWILLLGPLCGYGFLAGATWGIGDEAGGRWWRAWWSRRSAWVGLGPWIGLWTFWTAVYTLEAARWALAASGVDRWPRWDLSAWARPWMVLVAAWAGVAWMSLGWLPVARLALRRASRAGRLGAAWRAGLGLAATFVGSLFGGYWAITSAWRDYFFDPTIVP